MFVLDYNSNCIRVILVLYHCVVLLQVIGEPVFVVGNSLGGYVGTYVAAERPDLVRGVALLNATPFWAFSPHPKKQPLLARLWPWGGMLPAPRIVGSFVSVWWVLHCSWCRAVLL